MLARWINGVQMTTPQLGLSAFSVSLSSFARAMPSWRFMFIFQLPATIFFLIIFFPFINGLLLTFLSHLLHAQRRSAMVSIISGSTNHSSSLAILPGTLSPGIRPVSLSSRRFVSCCSLGRRLWLHFRITVPCFKSIRPGLLRIIVFSVVSSVVQKGYSAPVMSHQRFRAISLLAVRQ